MVTLEDGEVTYEESETGVVVLPREDDSVPWSGTLTRESPPPEPVEYSGEITIDLPFPIPDLSRSWGGTTDKVTNSDVDSYSVPGIVPGGVEFDIEGSHTQFGKTCRGEYTMEFEGEGVVSNIIGAVGTALGAVGIGTAARGKKA